VSTAPVDPSYAFHGNEIHFSLVFDGRTPTLCGRSGVPCPSTDEWRYVSCARCLALMVHARRAENDNAVCGVGGGVGRSTTRRDAVQCPACVAEIERRLRWRSVG
jgi:hypothetical protein